MGSQFSQRVYAFAYISLCIIETINRKEFTMKTIMITAVTSSAVTAAGTLFITSMILAGALERR